MAEAVVSADEIDTALRDQFLEAVRQVPWKSEQVSFRAKCVSTSDFQTISDSIRAELRGKGVDPNKPEVADFNCTIRGPLALTTGTGRRGTEYVRSKNSEYAFQVNRTSATKAYSLAFVEQLGAASAMDGRIQQAEDDARCFAFGGWYVFAEPVSHVVTSPTFQIKRVVAENRNGAGLVRIEFDRQYSDLKQRGYSYSNGFMVCDPERNWAMKEYGMTSFDGLILQTILTFGKLIDGLPIPQKITHLVSSADGKGDPTIRRQVIAIEVIGEDVPREEFYLRHYGLPEPNFRRGWFGTWVWYLIAGIVCLAVATIVAKRRRVRLA